MHSAENNGTALHFSFAPGFFEDHAERLLSEFNIQGAYQFLEKTIPLKTLTPEKRFLIYMRLLDKSATTDGNGMLSYDSDNNDTLNSNHPVFQYTAKMNDMLHQKNELIQKLTDQCLDLQHRLTFLAENLQNHPSGPSILSDAIKCYEKEREPNTPWLLQGSMDDIERSQITGNPVSLSPMNAMLTDYLNQARRERENEALSDCYGWLEPDGTFHSVPWCQHYTFARDYVSEHFPELRKSHACDPCGVPYICNPDEYLRAEKHWVLLHSPHNGTPNYMLCPGQRLTNAQKEFLFDFYTRMNLPGKANAIYLDDDD